jgi:CheY-like chemotaxis protein
MTSNTAGVPQRALRVLVADDDPLIRTLAAAALKKWRFDCHYANNGVTAIDLARTLLPDILVLDVMMPDLNGFEVLMLLKRDRRTRHIKVILLTSCDRASEIVRGYRLGADDYVTMALCSPGTRFRSPARGKSVRLRLFRRVGTSLCKHGRQFLRLLMGMFADREWPLMAQLFE